MLDEISVERRKAPRQTTDFQISATVKGQKSRLTIYDLSVGGCMIDSGGEGLLRAGHLINLEMPYAGTIEGTVLWTRGQFGGVQFAQQLHEAIIKQLGFKPTVEKRGEFVDRFGRPLGARGDFEF